MGVFAVDFRERARNWWGLLVSNRASFEGRRDGGEGQGAGVVRLMWTGVEMWEIGFSRWGMFRGAGGGFPRLDLGAPSSRRSYRR